MKKLHTLFSFLILGFAQVFLLAASKFAYSVFSMFITEYSLLHQYEKQYGYSKKMNVPASLHIYPSGNHGWGIKNSFRYREAFLTELREWLKSF
jgi:hypothetical protein